MTGTRKQHVAGAPSGSNCGRRPSRGSSRVWPQCVLAAKQVFGDGAEDLFLDAAVKTGLAQRTEVAVEARAVARTLVGQLETELDLAEHRLVAEGHQADELAREHARAAALPVLDPEHRRVRPEEGAPALLG